jgi:protein-tyrosine phosphatase
MTRIWVRLYLGSLADAGRLARANPNGIATVISLCEVSVSARRRDVNYLHIPIEDEEAVPVGQFEKVMDAIGKSIRWGTILIHCGVGMSRAPSLTAGWMAGVGYKNLDDALAEIQRLRPETNPSTTLLDSIRRHLL